MTQAARVVGTAGAVAHVDLEQLKSGFHGRLIGPEDPEYDTARVEAGATLAELDHETQAFGLAVPLGINSTTGVAGLTLGGGFGWLTRSLGLTVDNLISADVVTADGDYIHASNDEHADLFWALRGGGNSMPEDETGQDRLRAAYGPHWERLTHVKRRYDPENFFRMNQNIRPAAEEQEAAE